MIPHFFFYPLRKIKHYCFKRKTPIYFHRSRPPSLLPRAHVPSTPPPTPWVTSTPCSPFHSYISTLTHLVSFDPPGVLRPTFFFQTEMDQFSFFFRWVSVRLLECPFQIFPYLCFFIRVYTSPFPLHFTDRSTSDETLKT